jgi:hypothetical protein
VPVNVGERMCVHSVCAPTLCLCACMSVFVCVCFCSCLTRCVYVAVE